MSYEGFSQILCKQGHLSCPDAYDNYMRDYYGDETAWKCLVCGEEKAWENMVNSY